ncbi:MAG: hypothetical protein IT287_04900 [Bdellovibrionaceae bacterium]|nr:hypothetical protein [Pseudobdellovibrionaceae bacterium]
MSFYVHFFASLILVMTCMAVIPTADASTFCADPYSSICASRNNKPFSDNTHPANADQIQSLWQDIQVAATAVIVNTIPTFKLQNELIKKIKNVSLKVDICLNDPTLANANFSQAQQTVTYCTGNFSSSTSLFQQIAVLAHELGHSMEPCLSDLSNYFYKNVEQCLRDSHSVNASVFGFASKKAFLQQCSQLLKACENGMSFACANRERLGCLSGEARCSKDQINESFADWWSAEVLVQMVQKDPRFLKLSLAQKQNGFKNIVADSCDSRYPFDSTYPQPQTRYNQILLAHPSVRKLMNCKISTGDPLYCPAN